MFVHRSITRMQWNVTNVQKATIVMLQLATKLSALRDTTALLAPVLIGRPVHVEHTAIQLVCTLLVSVRRVTLENTVNWNTSHHLQVTGIT